MPGAEFDVDDAIVDLARRFAVERVDAARIDAIEDIDTRVLDELRATGLFGLTLPERFGGGGFGLPEASRVVAALAETDRSVATTLGLHLGLGSRGIVAFGNPTLRAEVLPQLASGDWIGAFSATEPEAGSDLSSLRTTLQAVGDGYVLNGAKVYVTNGGWAGCFTVAARILDADGFDRGKGLVAVYATDSGVTVGAEERKLGLRGSSTTEVHFDDVRLPAHRLLGAPGDGDGQLTHVLSWGRTVLAAGCLGAARAAYRKARAHAANRRQFGASLDQHPAVLEQLVDAAALLLAMRSTLDRACQGDERLVASSIAAKVANSEGAWEIADLAVQLHGGSGFIEDTGVPLILRDARIPRIFEGANDVLVQHAATLELARPDRTTPTGPCADERAAFEGSVDRVFQEARRAHPGVRLLRQPRHLWRLGRLVVLRETVRSVFDGGDAPPGLAEHWLKLARRRAAPLLEPVGALPALPDPLES